MVRKREQLQLRKFSKANTMRQQPRNKQRDPRAENPTHKPIQDEGVHHSAPTSHKMTTSTTTKQNTPASCTTTHTSDTCPNKKQKKISKIHPADPPGRNGCAGPPAVRRRAAEIHRRNPSRCPQDKPGSARPCCSSPWLLYWWVQRGKIQLRFFESGYVALYCMLAGLLDASCPKQTSLETRQQIKTKQNKPLIRTQAS